MQNEGRIQLSAQAWMQEGNWNISLEGPRWVLGEIVRGVSVLSLASYGGVSELSVSSAVFAKRERKESDDSAALQARIAELSGFLQKAWDTANEAEARVRELEYELERQKILKLEWQESSADSFNAEQALKPDAELGRLVRAMPDNIDLCKMAGQFMARRVLENGFDNTRLMDTPEEALRAAGIGQAKETAVDFDSVRKDGVNGAAGSTPVNWHETGRKEYCPATTDHFCPKAESCDGACQMEQAVKS